MVQWLRVWVANLGDPLRRAVSLENVLVGVGGQPILSKRRVCSPSCGEVGGAGTPTSLSSNLMVKLQAKERPSQKR